MAKQQTYTESYQDQLCKLYSFKEEKARYRKTYMNWDKIKRANSNAIRKKAKYLSKDAQAILAPVIQRLKKGECVFLNHKYISTITLCGRKQNTRIIKQLESVLNITYHNSITVDGKNYRYSYEFNFKHHTIQETEKQLNSAFIKHSVGTSKPQQNASLYIYKENKNIEDIDLESNFLQNSKSSVCPKKTTRIKKRATNERKKSTNAERKAKIYHFNQYKEPKDLKHHYPLIKEDGSKLQSLSGRDFSLNAMNEILLDMSKRLDNRFCSKAQFMAYFGKCLRFEMRDSVKTSNDNFLIKANVHREEVKKTKIINDEVAVKAYDLENRTTDGFQLLSVTLENLLVKSKAITE
ncbi:hypothetical protein MPCS_02010 (plasmid) [Candidatus Megaera polyxenophila]|nr:hypothetical protein MPCS_02010 [Candidatus Megaera polyxenophila]